MKKLVLLSIITLTISVINVIAGDTHIRISTYNIRGDEPRDGPSQWVFRKDSLCKIMLENDFDIVCFQEAVQAQLEDVLEITPYAFVGIRGLYNPILYKSDKYELLHTETFWLSETMEILSKGWDGKYDRYCTWAKFRDRLSGRVFFVFNTHLDHRGMIARPAAAALIVQQIKRFVKDEPVFFCGDMNSTDDTEAYQAITSEFLDSRLLAPKIYGPVGTAHNFGKVEPVKIDYIFVNDKIEVVDYSTIDEEYGNGFYPSDHYPVFINAILKPDNE